MGCTRDVCMGSKVNKPCYKENETMLNKTEMKIEATQFIEEYYKEK